MQHGSFGVPNDAWITEGNTPDPSPLPTVLGWNVLIRPLSIRTQTKGGILLPDKLKDDLYHVTTVGKVLRIGPLAFQRKDMYQRVEVTRVEGYKEETFVYRPWFKVGDYVTYARYAGVKYTYKGVKLLLMQESEVHMVLESPNDVDPSYGFTQ